MSFREQFVSSSGEPATVPTHSVLPYGVFALVTGRERRVWDSNPRGRFPALAVFKTAAIGH